RKLAEMRARSEEEARRDREAWEQKLAQSWEVWEQKLAEMWARWEAAAERDRQAWEQKLARSREEWEKKLAQRRQEWEQETKEERRAWNKRWGELANRLGTVVEDIVAPNIPRIARDYFGFPEIEDFMVRRKVRHKRDRTRRREFDVIAVGEDWVIINETKTSPRLEDIRDFIKALEEIEDYFPEYRGKRIIPIFASLYMGEDMVNYLTRHRIYAMAMGDETMDLLNFQALGDRGIRRPRQDSPGTGSVS
ncbi:MAG: hypothetical protein D6759_04920, partial [Chloroflexi bacterium]